MDNLSVANMTTHKGGVLEQNCRDDWPRWTCIFANVCGLCSTALWFIVLFPQIWKNFHRKSVLGLSVLWATANFTASLINLFFVFLYASIPIYGQISSVYCPILELTLLCQFWIYGRYRNVEKIVYACCCMCVWGIVIAVELIFHVENFVEYAAIFLWCVETFPQILLNMRRHSASGQAVGSAFIAMIGKTTDFIATNTLVMPMQYVIMCYFSSSVAYINGLQVAWYYGNDSDSKLEGRVSNQNVDNDGHENPAYQRSTESMTFRGSREKEMTNILGSANEEYKQSKIIFTIRWLCIGALSVFLVSCVAWFTWNVRSLFGLFAPFAIMCVLGLAKLYFHYCASADYSLRDSF